MTDVLNRILSILNTVVRVVDDMEQCREKQLNDGTGNQTETEWQIFSDHKTEENSLEIFWDFKKEY